MAFDIEGARQGGYSDSEIVDYLAPKSNFDVLGARQGGYSDAEILFHLATKSAPKQEAKPEDNSGNLVRGFTSYGPAMQQTIGGAQTFLGLGAEKTIGQGVVSNYLMEKGAKNLKESEVEQQRTSKPTDEFTNAWEKGIGSVVTEWLPYQIGSGAANLLESAAIAAVGSVAGTAVVPGIGTVGGGLTLLVSKQLAKKGIKEAAEQVLKERGKDAAEAFIQAESKKVVNGEIAALTERGAKKLIGSTAATGVQAGLHGMGEVTSAAVQEAEKQGLTARDIDLGKVVPAAAIHSVADFISTRIGLGALDGLAAPTKNMLFNIVKSVGVTTAKEIPPELLQSAMELYGAGLPLDDQNAIKNYINTAAATVGMSLVPGVAGGLRTRPQAPGTELEAPPAGGQPPAQEPFKPTVIPPAYSVQEGIDRAAGVNAGSGYTQADLLTPGAEGVREQAQRLAAQRDFANQRQEQVAANQAANPSLNPQGFKIGEPRQPMTEEGRIAALQAAQQRDFANQRQEQLAANQAANPTLNPNGFNQGRTPPPAPINVTPSQSQPYTAPAPVSNEERRKRVDAQAADLAKIQNEPFEFDRRRLAASASGTTGQVRGQPRAELVDTDPMPPAVARNRLRAMQDELISYGQDPNSVAIVPHPTMGGRFAIERRFEPQKLYPNQKPPVTQGQAYERLADAQDEVVQGEQRAANDLKTLAGKRGEELAQNVPPKELAPFIEAHQTLRRNVEENIANRKGVATPEEARMIREQGLGIPYDSIAEITEAQDSTLNTKGTKLLALENDLDEQRRKHQKELHGPEIWMEGFNVPEGLPPKASEQFTGKFLNPEGRTAPAAPTQRTAAKTTPEQFGNRSEAAVEQETRNGALQAQFEPIQINPKGRSPSKQNENAPKIKRARYSKTEEGTQTPQELAEDIRKNLLPILKRFGLGKVGLRLVDSIRSSNGDKAEGMYFKRLITLAMDFDNPLGVMRHETVHALRELGAFTDGEWKVLTHMAKTKWIDQFYSPQLQAMYKAQFVEENGTEKGFDDYMAEEAIAQAFRYFTETKPPSGMIANLMRRLNAAFNAIREFFMGNGVTNSEQLFLANQIFSSIESGRLTEGRAGVQPKAAPAYSKTNPLESYVNKDEAASRVQRKVERAADVGEPNNERQVFTSDIDTGNYAQPYFPVGKITLDDWTKRVQSLMSPEEIKDARVWYKQLHDAFTPLFGPDASKYALAWLLSQQRASPTKGLSNVLRASDLVAGKQKLVTAGLNEQALVDVLSGKVPSSGIGAKLMDFVDSELGLKKRTWMGGDAQGRQPAAIDVWAQRDVGFIDDTVLEFIRKNFGEEAAKSLTVDKTRNGESQYEYGIDFYNDLVDKFNKDKFMGGDWEAREVQAVGWVTMQRAMGIQAEFVRDIIGGNTRRVSLGLAPGEGSVMTNKLMGKEIPTNSAQRVLADLAKLANVKVQNSITGVGAYLTYVKGSIQIESLASKEAVLDYMDMLGFVFQQTEMINTRALKSGKNMAIDVMSDTLGNADDAVKLFIEFLNHAPRKGNDPLAAGFQQINLNGKQGIRLLNFEGNWRKSDVKLIEDALNTAAQKTNIKLDDIVTSQVELTKTKNDWTKDHNGQAYLDSLKNRGRVQEAEYLQREFPPSRFDLGGDGTISWGKARFSLSPESNKLALRPSDSGAKGISFNDRKEDAVSYAGSHYGKTKTNILSGGYYGTGLKGAEARRLAESKDFRIKKRIYFYIPRANGTMPYRESGVGNHVYTQKFDNILGPGKTMSELSKKAKGDSNAFESLVIDNGYDGYSVPDYGMMVILNNDVQAKYEGTVGDVHYKKPEENVVVTEKGVRFAKALGSLEPSTFLVSDVYVNNTGDLGMMPDARGINKKPIRLAVGMEDNATSKGFGANHILNRIEKDATRKPPVISKELLEDLIRNIEKTAQSFTRLYKDRNNFIAYNPTTTESLILAERPDHYSVITSYRQNNMGKYGNIAWTGKTPEILTLNKESAGSKVFGQVQKGISVKAGLNRVERQAIPTIVKAKRVMSPEAIQAMADDMAAVKLQGRASLRAPTTPQFKKFFEGSQVVNKDGTPKPMYHATNAPEEGELFSVFRESDDGKLGAGIYFTSMPEYSENYAPTGAIMPVYLSIKNPLFIELGDDALTPYKNTIYLSPSANTSINKQLDKKIKELTGGKKSSYDLIGEQTKELLQKAGYDGVIARDSKGNFIETIAFKPNQIKSAIGNTGAFSRESNDIRYSLAPLTKLTSEPTTGKAINDAIKTIQGVNGARINYVDRASALRQILKSLPRFNEETNKLRADQLWNSQIQAQNLIKTGLTEGVPVVQADGTIGIEKSENNLANAAYIADTLDVNPTVVASGRSGRSFVAEIARILRGEDILREDADNHAEARRQLVEADKNEAKLKAEIIAGVDPKTVAKAQNAINQMRKEAKEALEVNREKEVTPEHIAWAKENLAAVPKVQDVLDIWKNVNNALLKMYLDTGKISQETYEKYVANKYYVPLFKSAEDMNADGSFGYRGTGVKRPEKFFQLKGAKNLQRNMWENVDKQYAAMIASAYENQTRRTAVEQMRGLDAKNARTEAELKTAIDNGDLPEGTEPNLVYQDGGQDIKVFVEDTNILAAFQSMNYVLTPVMKFFGAFSKLLRAGALLNPMFWLKQLVRDATAATITGSSFVTPVHSAAEFARIVFKRSEEYKILAARGIVGPIDNVMSLNEYIGSVGKEKKSAGMLMKGINKALEIHEASDAATKVAVFKQAKAEALKKGLSEENAINYAVHKARESINFAITGNSPLLNNLRHMIPFMSATIVGLDTVYRAMKGYGLNPEEKAKAQRTFATRAFALFTMSLLYAMMMQGDDDYKDLPDYVKDNSYLFPLSNVKGKTFLEIPITYEIGYMFKTLPEAMVRYMAGTSTGKEVIASLVSGFIQNVPMGGLPIPQAAKPALEVIFNHSLFTGRTLEGMGDQKLPVAQRGDKASEASKFLSGLGLDKIGLSPIKIDALTKGYFAEFGTFANELIDALVHQANGKNPAPKNFQNMPFFKSFVTDPYASKAVSDFYKIEGSAQETANLFAKYKNQGNVEGIKEIIEDKEALTQLSVSKPLGKIQTEMAKVKNAIKVIDNDKNMSPSEKRNKMNELQDIVNNLGHIGSNIAADLKAPHAPMKYALGGLVKYGGGGIASL